MAERKNITWFKDDDYNDFCFLRLNKVLYKCTIEKTNNNTYNTFSARGYVASEEYIKKYTSGNSWSIAELNKLLEDGYHFPKRTPGPTFESLQEAKDFILQQYELAIRGKDNNPTDQKTLTNTEIRPFSKTNNDDVKKEDYVLDFKTGDSIKNFEESLFKLLNDVKAVTQRYTKE